MKRIKTIRRNCNCVKAQVDQTQFDRSISIIGLVTSRVAGIALNEALIA